MQKLQRYLCAFSLCTTSILLSSLCADPTLPVMQDFSTVAEKAIPAVVSIQVKIKSKGRSVNFGQGSFQGDFFERFFNFPGMPDDSSQEDVGQASGFIISADGQIITNSHVVKDATEISVTLNDGKEYTAKLIGQDPSSDVALIKIEADNLPSLQFANPETLKVGQWAIAVGSPMGLDATLTVGVISAKGRNNLDIARVEDFIQTDAAINRGNSGGPLLNINGEVIGMNTAIVSNNGSGYMGIGFAIPSNIIKNDIEQILAKGSVSRGFIGVALQQVDTDIAQALGLDKASGLLISEVTKDSPAEKAGLKQGDVILKYNDTPIHTVGSFRNSIALMSPGTKVTLSIVRKGESPTNLMIEVGNMPEQVTKKGDPAKQASKLGFEVEELNPELARSLGYADQKGIVISKVLPNTAAAWAGLKKGTLILSVNQQAVNDIDQFNQQLDALDPTKPTLLLVKQGALTRFISIKVKN